MPGRRESEHMMVGRELGSVEPLGGGSSPLDDDCQ